MTPLRPQRADRQAPPSLALALDTGLVLVAVLVAQASLTVLLPLLKLDNHGRFAGILSSGLLALLISPLLLWRTAAVRRRALESAQGAAGKPGEAVVQVHAQRRDRLRAMYEAVFLAAALLSVAGIGLLGVWRSSTNAIREEFRSGLQRLARGAATVVDLGLHEQLRSPEQLDSPLYQRAVAPLRRFREALPEVRYLYTAVRDGDQVRFVLDAADPGDNDGDGIEDRSGVWEVYDDFEESLTTAMGEQDRPGEPTASAEPHTDRWGTFLSGYAPLVDARGRRCGVVGVDIDARNYLALLAEAGNRSRMGVIPAVGLAVVLGIVVFLVRVRALVAERCTAEARFSAEVALRNLESYRAIIDKHAIVSETDVHGNITRVNDQFCEISEYSRAEVIGRTHRLINSGRHPASMWKEMWSAISSGGSWRGEICNRARSGALYWVNATLAPMFDASGRIRGYFSVRTDITPIKLAQERLAEALAAARSATVAKSEFLANMSHEIRTPMTAIMGFAELLGDHDVQSDPRQRLEYITTIKRNGEHLLTIINDILDLSKIEAGKMTVEQLETRPDQLVAEVLSLMHPKAAGQGIKLEAQYDSPIPATIRSDPVRLRQILINLVGNAIKFTQVGGVTIRVSLQSSPAREPELRLQIVDTGVGMTSEQLQRLFQPFEQADASTTRRFGGTGLGLQISKRFAEMLGGSISAVSEVGVGSVFTLAVATGPLAGVPMVAPGIGPDVAGDRSQEAEPSSGEPPLKGLRILLAEDGPDNQRLIAFQLRNAGAVVYVAGYGRLAVEALTRDGTVDAPLVHPLPVDLILTDMQMPEMDGYSATRLLRSKGCDLPILALTAHAMRGDADKCLAAGCDDYATKPINRRVLLRMCREWGLGVRQRNAPAGCQPA